MRGIVAKFVKNSFTKNIFFSLYLPILIKHFNQNVLFSQNLFFRSKAGLIFSVSQLGSFTCALYLTHTFTFRRKF